MTLRDLWDWLSNFWGVVVADIQTVFQKNILEWPIWTVVLIAVVLALLILPSLATVKKEEREANADDGIWGSAGAMLVGICFIGYAIFAAFTGRHGLPAWLGFVGLISWPILVYGFILKVSKWFKG